MNNDRFNDIKECLEMFGYCDMDDEEYKEYLMMGGEGCNDIVSSKLDEVNVLECMVGKLN